MLTVTDLSQDHGWQVEGGQDVHIDSLFREWRGETVGEVKERIRLKDFDIYTERTYYFHNFLQQNLRQKTSKSKTAMVGEISKISPKHQRSKFWTWYISFFISSHLPHLFLK